MLTYLITYLILIVEKQHITFSLSSVLPNHCLTLFLTLHSITIINARYYYHQQTPNLTSFINELF